MRAIAGHLVMLLTLVPSLAQSEPQEDSAAATTDSTAAQVARAVVEHVDIYGRAAGHLSLRDQEIDFRNNGSRFGIRADAPILGAFTVHGQFEFAVKLGSADESLNLDSSAGGEFGRLVVEFMESDECRDLFPYTTGEAAP